MNLTSKRRKAPRKPRRTTPAVAPRPRAPRMASAARRRQILMCALTESAERGLGHARHSDVARAAGVAVPTVFHYFKTRAALAEAVIDEVQRLLFDDIVAPCFARDIPAPEALIAILLAFADAIDTDPDQIRVWLGWSSAVHGDYWPAYLAFHRRAMREVSRKIEAGKRAGTLSPALNTEDEARVVIGLAHMIAQMKFAGNERPAIERTVRFLIEGYLSGRG